MSTNKKVSYISLLKEAVENPENDTTKTVDVKGPMLEPILSYDGTGELKTTRDAASILERYYFRDDDSDITTLREAEEDEGVGNDSSQDPINTIKKDIVKTIEEEEKKEDKEEEDKEEEDEGTGDVETEIPEEVNEFESAVLERLISEMEEEDSEEDSKEDSEEKDSKEKEKIVGEQEKVEDVEDVETKTGEELNVDKEMEEGFVPGQKGSENTDEEEVNEMFNIFREAIEDDDMDEEDLRKKIPKKK